MCTLYESLVQVLVEDSRREEHVIGVLLTGSLAPGDAVPGAHLDARFLLADGYSCPSRTDTQDGILVERRYDDMASAEATLASDPTHMYAYLDGRILLDQEGVLARLTQLARQRFETYQTPDRVKSTIEGLLKWSRHRILVATIGGDQRRAALVTRNSSWLIVEGLWAANNRPLPPNSSIPAHLRDLSQGPPDVDALYEQLFLGETRQRVRAALNLIDWTLAHLSSG